MREIVFVRGVLERGRLFLRRSCSGDGDVREIEAREGKDEVFHTENVENVEKSALWGIGEWGSGLWKTGKSDVEKCGENGLVFLEKVG